MFSRIISCYPKIKYNNWQEFKRNVYQGYSTNRLTVSFLGNQNESTSQLQKNKQLVDSSKFNIEKLLGDIDKQQDIEKLYKRLIAKERASLAKAITLVESTNPAKQKQAQFLLTKVLRHIKELSQHALLGPGSFRIGTV